MSATLEKPMVGILTGRDADWPTMQAATEALAEFGAASAARVISAHRDLRGLEEYFSTAISRGIKVIIAGAGAAAHLPGVTAAHILAVGDECLQGELKKFKVRLTEASRAKNKTLASSNT